MKKLILVMLCFTGLTFSQSLGVDGLTIVKKVTLTSTSASTLPYQPTAGEEALYYLNGNSTDASPNGFDGTDNNVSYTTDAAFTGFVASFGGTNSYITNGSFTPMASQNIYMVFAWFKSSSTTRQGIFHIDNSLGSIFINISTSISAADGFAYLYITSGVGGDLIAGAANICDGTKHFIVGQRNGTKLELFVDGVSVATSSTATATAYTTSTMFIGSVGATPDFPFSGVIGTTGLIGGNWSAAHILKYYNDNK